MKYYIEGLELRTGSEFGLGAVVEGTSFEDAIYTYLGVYGNKFRTVRAIELKEFTYFKCVNVFRKKAKSAKTNPR